MRLANLGMPNVYGPQDKAGERVPLIKTAVENFWAGKTDQYGVIAAELEVRDFNKRAQEGIDLIPQFDIDIYDRLLKTAVMFGLTPKRFGSPQDALEDIGAYLSIGRGTQKAPRSSMVKWFNTNYHVLRPEIERDPEFLGQPRVPETEPVRAFSIIGPWTFLAYSTNKTEHDSKHLFEKLAEQYAIFINQLPPMIIQLEEPSFLTRGIPDSYREFLSGIEKKVHLHVYFGSANGFAKQLFSLPVDGIGLDFVDGPENVQLLDDLPKNKVLIAGIINGKNVWPASTKTKETLESICKKVPDSRLYISPSCPLVHVPLTVQDEREEIRTKFSFALEKLEELKAIKKDTIEYQDFKEEEVQLPTKRYERSRKTVWVSEIPYPTTTIGSFPQTKDLKNLRKKWKKGTISNEVYESDIKERIKNCIKKQEDLGLDVLVHGEFERADMVEYFAEQLEGYTIIKSPVQSYGTRHVRPPIIVGDIKRKKPMTVDWFAYAQSLTQKPVKGMLTGPVTMVQWSYPRENLSREEQFYQVADALAAEIADLVKAGTACQGEKDIHIQIDEPALREGLPINKDQRAHYLLHAVNAFRKSFGKTPNNVVIHSHMCYSEFGDIIDAIKDLGCDVLSIEDSGAEETAKILKDAGIPFAIGLGCYDVHSPRIPTTEEIIRRLRLSDWALPGCGLKTRGEEAYEQLKKMMEGVHILRQTPILDWEKILRDQAP